MDWHKNRLWIGSAVLVVLGGAAIWMMRRNTGDSPAGESDIVSDFPDVDRDQVAALEITRPEDEESIRLERRDEVWRIVRPLDVPADAAAVRSALDTLHALEVAAVASRNPQFHEELEVDAEHGVRVVARDADDHVLADLWLGAYRAGRTMVRVEGQDRVVAVAGSIKHAFNRALRDWRDRAVLDVSSDEVREISWVGPNGTFRFTRPEVPREREEGEGAEGEGAEGAGGEGEDEAPETELGDWQIAEVSYMPPTPDGGVPAAAPSTAIEGFAPTKVRTMVSSLARMRASDFAAAEVTPEGAGIGEASPRATLTTRAGERHTVLLGRESSAEQHNFYAMREGSDTIFVVSQFLAQRVHPTASSFEQTAAATAPPEEEEGGAGAGGAPTELPPEVLEQLRRQIEAGRLGGGAGP